MAVLEVVDLPNQPAAGSAIFHALGGDGWFAPQSRVEIDASLAMDASGGAIRLSFTLDPQYESIVALMQIGTDETTAGLDFQVDVALKASTNFIKATGVVVPDHEGGQSRLWMPPPIINPLKIDFRMDNTDTFTMVCIATIYQFRKTASQRVPLSELFRCLARGGALI